MRTGREGRYRPFRAAVPAVGGGRIIRFYCYPPDAIALALRAGVPIYATQDALTHAEPSPTPPPGAVSEWLERVRPSDFRPISDEA